MNAIATNANVATPAANTNAKSGGATITPSTFIGGRVAGPPVYTPAHMKPGAAKPTSAKCDVNIIMNRYGKKETYRFTGWGKMADIIARGASTGKEVTITGVPSPYMGRVWQVDPVNPQNRTYITDPATNQPILTAKMGFNIENIRWHNDSAKTIQEEITAQVRPMGWNDPTQPGYAQWREICAQRNATQFQQGMTQFVFARVQNPPQGAQIVTGNVANNAAGGYAQPVAGQQAGFQGVAQVPVQQAVAPVQPVQQVVAAPAQPAQVMVNGQNMGYAAPAQQPAQGAPATVAAPAAVY